MLWFLERDDESLKLETRYDNDTSEFVVIVRHLDGRERTEQFTDGATSMVHGSRRSSATSNISTGLGAAGRSLCRTAGRTRASRDR